MVNYSALYARMVAAAERAIEELEHQNYGTARELLIAAEQECEERYLADGEQPADAPV